MTEIKEIKTSDELFAIEEKLYEKTVNLDLFFISRKIECCDGCLLIIGPSASEELEYYIIKNNKLYNDIKEYLEKRYC